MAGPEDLGKISEADGAFLAGLINRGGSIYVTGGKNGKDRYPQVCLKIRGLDEDVARRVKDLIPGTHVISGSNTQWGNHFVTQGAALALVEAHPYLSERLKKQAHYVFEFAKASPRRGTRITLEQRKVREKALEALRRGA